MDLLLLMPSNDLKTATLRVSDLNRRVKQLLESQFSAVWVEGELSNLTKAASGHWYFTLKDAEAQVRCAMFRSRASLIRVAIRPGDMVRVRGRVSLYEGRGDFQLIVDQLEPAGAGALQAAFEALKQKLAAQGMLDSARKRPLPVHARRVAVITSPTGAAVRDILTVLARRAPQLAVDIFPSPVQGGEAAPGIVAALAHLERLLQQGQRYDAVVVGRGGGSMEDLWAFNEESVARAIAACSIPVVSAVGHEIDFTIADFVADIRAPTPSAAAELLSPDNQELLLALHQTRQRLVRAMQQRLSQAGETLLWLRRSLRHPGDRLREQMQRLDDLEQQLHRAMGRRLQLEEQRLARAAALLHSLSPLSTLSRGYAIVRNKNGVALTRAEQCQIGEDVSVRLATGSLACRVTGKQEA